MLLFQLLSRVDTITTPQVISLLIRNSRYPVGLKGSDARDLLFARLFGLTALINSRKLFKAESSLKDFENVLDQLLEIGEVKGWLRESAWWGIVCAVEGLLSSEIDWQEEGLDLVLERCFQEGKAWSPEKVALGLILERARPVCGATHPQTNQR
jgi:DNA polymerase phi